jgi:hypothetical protein
MTSSDDTLELRLAPAAPAETVASPLLTAMGARAGLTIQALDELQMAVEMLLHGRREGVTTVQIRIDGRALVVSIAPVPAARSRPRAQILEQLAGRVAVDGEKVELRAGG